MGQDAFGDAGQFGGGFGDAVASFGVALDFAPFVAGEFFWFVEDVLVDDDLADVVEFGQQIEFFDFALWQAELLADFLAEDSQPISVVAGLDVAVRTGSAAST